MKKLLVLTIFSLFCAGAVAAPYFEVGDAGDLPGGAQVVTAGSDGIAGTADGDTDVDMFAFTWGGGLFEAEVVNTFFDTQLWLFDATGSIVAENDDFGSQLSFISLALTAGDYFLALNVFNNDALNGSGENLADCLNGAPCGGGLVLASWSGDVDNEFDDPRAYEIAFNTAVGPTTDVAEPGTLALLGISFLGMAALRRKFAA